MKNSAMKKELEGYKAAALGDVSKEMVKDGVEINGITLIAKEFKDYTIDALRKLSDDVKASEKNIVMVLPMKAAEK